MAAPGADATHYVHKSEMRPARELTAHMRKAVVELKVIAKDGRMAWLLVYMGRDFRGNAEAVELPIFEGVLPAVSAAGGAGGTGVLDPLSVKTRPGSAGSQPSPSAWAAGASAAATAAPSNQLRGLYHLASKQNTMLEDAAVDMGKLVDVNVPKPVKPETLEQLSTRVTAMQSAYFHIRCREFANTIELAYVDQLVQAYIAPLVPKTERPRFKYLDALQEHAQNRASHYDNAEINARRDKLAAKDEASRAIFEARETDQRRWKEMYTRLHQHCTQLRVEIEELLDAIAYFREKGNEEAHPRSEVAATMNADVFETYVSLMRPGEDEAAHHASVIANAVRASARGGSGGAEADGGARAP